MLKLLSALALLLASAAVASATPTRFYLTGALGNGDAYVSGLIAIDPATGAVQPGDILLSVRGFPPLNIPNQTYDLSFQSITSTAAVNNPIYGFVDGITELRYADASGTYVALDISADSGSPESTRRNRVMRRPT